MIKTKEAFMQQRIVECEDDHKIPTQIELIGFKSSKIEIGLRNNYKNTEVQQKPLKRMNNPGGFD